MESPEWGMMHSLLQVPVKSAVFGRFCFACAYRDRSETYRQRYINSKHTVCELITLSACCSPLVREGRRDTAVACNNWDFMVAVTGMH